MRTNSLRALLATLRAGGVSEFIETRKGVTTSIKLGSAPAERSASAHSSSAKAAKALDVESARRRQEMLAEMEISESQLAQAMEGIS